MKQTQDKQPKVVEVQAGAWHPGPMTDADFEAWKNLANKVVWRHFRWAFEGQDAAGDVQLDDLLQEARLGLMDAWVKYNPAHASAAKFVTYAYTVIHRRVKNYALGKFSTPNTTGAWNQGGGKNDEEHRNGSSTNWLEHLDAIEDKREDGEGKFVCDDFNAECLELLKDHLPKGGYAILVESFRGKTFQEIGKRHGYSREHARKLYNEMMVKAADILQRKDEV